MQDLSVEEIRKYIGRDLGRSDWFVIDQARVDAFAEVTGDFQFVHVDPARAAQTPMGGTIAHGFLLLSLFPLLVERSDCPVLAGIRLGLNYGSDKVRFLSPVRVGKRVRGHFTLEQLFEKRPGQWQLTTDYTLEIEGEEKPALIASWTALYYL